MFKKILFSGRVLSLLLLTGLLTSCVTFKHGIVSVPKDRVVVEILANDVNFEYVKRDDIFIGVDMKNRFEVEVVSGLSQKEPINEMHPDDNKRYYEININLKPRARGFVFKPYKVDLIVDTKKQILYKAYKFIDYELDQKDRLRLKDTYELDYRKHLDHFKLEKAINLYQLVFDKVTPNPKQHIILDFSRALIHPDEIPIHKIEFTYKSYREAIDS